MAGVGVLHQVSDCSAIAPDASLNGNWAFLRKGGFWEGQDFSRALGAAEWRSASAAEGRCARNMSFSAHIELGASR